MQTIDDIRFNAHLYENCSVWAILLCQQNRVNVPIQLSNADLMSFVEPFNNIAQCQGRIQMNPRKLVTLFVDESNIQPWLTSHNVPNNVQEIRIFCDSNDRLFVNALTRRHAHRFQHTTWETIGHETLNYRLLLFGVDQLKEILRSDFEQGSNSYQQAHQNYKSICHALANYFWSEANN